MNPTQHEKNEWSRLAQDAYSKSLNAIGHRYSAYASIPRAATITVAMFDSLQVGYRRWLIDGDFSLASA